MATHHVPPWASPTLMERTGSRASTQSGPAALMERQGSRTVSQRSRARSQASISASITANKKSLQVPVDERDKNRALLQNEVKKTAELETDVALIQRQLRQEVAEIAEMHENLLQDQQSLQQEQLSISELRRGLSEELAAMKQVRQDMAGLHSENARLAKQVDAAAVKELGQQVDAMRAELQKATALSRQSSQAVSELNMTEAAAVKELKQQVDALRAELQKATALGRQSSQAVSVLKKDLSEVKDSSKAASSLQSELQRMKEDLGKMKQEIQENKSLKPEIAKLKEGLKSNDELVRMKSRSELTSLELKELQKRLLDCGVLAPVRDEPPQEDSPPVGCIELGEDIFSARLLIRLGFMKAFNGGRENSYLSGSDRAFRIGYGEVESDAESDTASFNDVTGIVTPDVEEGGWAYCEVTCGWVFICIVTICLQLLILMVMLRSYMLVEGECFSGSALSWWLLHLSRCTATIVAGTLMTKELMDTVNYWMISELLEPSMSWEVMFTTVVRVLMQFLIVAASVFLFLGSTDPAETWMNMTALGFIAMLGNDILEVAKRGVFGHHIQGAITSLNYQLTLERDYPSWFASVRYVTLLMSVAGVTCFAVFIFVRSDPVCGEHVHDPNATLSAPAAHARGGGGHHR